MKNLFRSISPVFGIASSLFLTAGQAYAAPIGFYRFSGNPAVFYQYSDSHYCHVQNEVQMGAFGGFNRVRVQNYNNLSGSQTGSCGWPNGLYRGSQFREVYYLYGSSQIPSLGDKYCHVTNENELQRIQQLTGSQVTVINLAPNEYFNLKSGRSGTGTCRFQ